MSEFEKTVHLNGIRSTMRVKAAFPGCGPTVVFLHGLLGDSGQWDIFDRYHAPRSYSDAYYLDFHFEQRRPHALSFDEIVEETLDLLRNGPGLFSKPLALVGSSFGGHLALYIAAKGLAWADRMVLVAPGGIPEVMDQRGLLQSYRTVDKIFEVSFERLFADPSVASNPEIKEVVRTYRDRVEPYRRDWARNLLDISKGMQRHLLSHQDLRGIDSRVLFIWGRQDVITPPRVCRVMLDHIPNSRVEWVDCGHAAHIERPDLVSGLLRDFCLEESREALAVGT